MTSLNDCCNSEYKKPNFFIRALTYALAILGFVFLLLIFSIIGMLNREKVALEPLPKKMVLSINLSNVYNEVGQDDLMLDLSGMNMMSYYDLINAIHIAAMDKKVKALFVDISDESLGLAQAQEFRRAIKNFKSKDKKTIAFSRGGSLKSYYIASAFDNIYIQPKTELAINGISAEVPFVKGLLKKIGVEPEFYTRHEHKTAVSSFMNSKITKEHKKELTEMTSGIFNQLIDDISKDRKIEKSELVKIVDKSPLYVNNLDEKSSKLIDTPMYSYDVRLMIHNETGGKLVDLESYAKHIKENKTKLAKVALLVLDGTIDEGYSKQRPFDKNVIGSYSVLEQLDEIAMDKEIKAIILRINSPGGGYYASDEIREAIEKVKEFKKIPVIVSMSDYAASGGYFIAMAGDYILAEKATITGSIGVLGGKIVLSDLWNKLGINWERVSVGKNSGIFSPNRKFSESEKKAFNKSLDNIYIDFTSIVAEKRKFDAKKIDTVARGRVWTGEKALEVGLVDEIGGITEAMLKTQNTINQFFQVVYYPKKKTIQEKISEFVRSKPVSAEVTSSVLNEIGISSEEFYLLKRLEYDAILAPFRIYM